MFLLWLVFEEVIDKGECLCSDISQRIEREHLDDTRQLGSQTSLNYGNSPKMAHYLQNLQQREEILLEPVLKVPDNEMLVCDPGMEKRLVTEISVRHD